jgi:hypothetical protein
MTDLHPEHEFTPTSTDSRNTEAEPTITVDGHGLGIHTDAGAWYFDVPEVLRELADAVLDHVRSRECPEYVASAGSCNQARGHDGPHTCASRDREQYPATFAWTITREDSPTA